MEIRLVCNRIVYFLFRAGEIIAFGYEQRVPLCDIPCVGYDRKAILTDRY